MDLEKIVEIGERMGLKDEKLQDFVKERENMLRQREMEKYERDERAAEREASKMKQQYELEMNRKDTVAKLVMKEKEIELEKLKLETSLNESGLNISHVAQPSSQAKLPKLPVFDDKFDSIDAYLHRFERFAENAKWDRSTWSINLSALLKGKALDVYSRLPSDVAMNYEMLKQELLKRFQLTEEGFHTKFRTSQPETGESPPQFVARLESYLERWMLLAEATQTFEGLKDLLLREQFLASCNKTLTTFLKERHPKDVNEMTLLAEQYIEAHGEAAFSGGQQDRRNDGRKCYECGRHGHIARECRLKQNTGERHGVVMGQGASYQQHTQSKFQQQQSQHSYGRGRGDFVGRGRGKYDNRASGNGHLGSACIITDKLMECCVQDNKVKLVCGHALPVIGGACKVCENMPVYVGYVGKTSVQVLRHSGCSSVVVKRKLLRDDQFTGETRSCVLIDGTIRNVPETSIDIDTPFYTGRVKALAMENPVFDLIIGNIDGARSQSDPNPDWHEPMKEIVVEEISDEKENLQILQAVQTRGQKEKEAQGMKSLKVTSSLDIDVTVEDMRKAQEEDKSLSICWNNAKSGKKLFSGINNVSWFVIEKGLLYRRFQSPKISDNKIFKQLVVPQKYRETVMKLAHDCIFSGHLGTKKTTDRIMSSFYWQGLQGDVCQYCRSCDVCQRTHPKGKVQKVPLVHMPLIDTPFERVAVDLVGPISPVTDRGNRYILTLVDYSTRHPEAVALKGIETERVAEALVEIFTRVGIPKEILSDMGTQFTSNLMKEIGRLLSMKQLNTTPYHPACNGLVEKFNGTLKQMLRRMSAERPKDWDRYLPALLFAYREAPQESLGFSPFELLYGRTVRGPMSVLREIWTNEQSDPEVETTYQYVLDLKERLADTCEMAQKELKKSSARYKKYYDRKSKSRLFAPGDKY